MSPAFGCIVKQIHCGFGAEVLFLAADFSVDFGKDRLSLCSAAPITTVVRDVHKMVPNTFTILFVLTIFLNGWFDLNFWFSLVFM